VTAAVDRGLQAPRLALQEFGVANFCSSLFRESLRSQFSG